GNGTAGENTTVFLDIHGNTSAGSGGTDGIGLRKQGTNASVDVFGIEDMTGSGSSPDVESYVNSKNPNGGGTLLISATSGFISVNHHPLLAAPGGVQAWTSYGTGNFNGDGVGEQLLQRDSDHMLGILGVDSSGTANLQMLGTVGAEWHIQ